VLVRLAVLLALLLAVPASAIEGRFPRAGPSAPPVDVVEDPWVDCSKLPDPAFTPVDVTSASDLHTVAMANCGSGCILELAPGTYTDTNVIFGETAIKGDSVAPSGEVVIRGADRNNPPVLRAELGVNAAIIHARNITPRIRLEDVILDGRRSEQTTGARTACTDTTPNNGICDTGSQTSTFAGGFNTRNTGAGTTRSCLLRVQVRDTVTTGIQLSQPFVSTVQDSSVTRAGCTVALCTPLAVPLDATTNSITKTAQGVQLVGGSDSAVVNTTISDVTKIGIECFTNSRRCQFHDNTVTGAGIAGIVFNEGDGTASGNTIDDTGFTYAQNTTSDNVGQGIQVTNGNTYAASKFTTRIEGNTIEDAWGSGIQIGLAGTTYNDMRVDLTRNIVRGACNGTTRADSAGIELGDSTYDIAQITASYNSNTGDSCVDGMRVRNVRTHRNDFNGTQNGFEVDDVDEFQGRDLDVVGNIDIDADSKGFIQRCTVSGVVLGSDGVQRPSCGETPADVMETDWDALVWDTDEWG
jgi:hypothetical protein